MNTKKKKNTKKKNINVFIILGSSRSSITATRIKNSEGEYFYTGFIWDIWQHISNKLKNKYNFKVIFSTLEDNNYDNFVDDVKEKKYQLVIGCFNYNKSRERKINYTTPFMIDANSIIYRAETSIIRDLKRILYSDAALMILYALLIGIAIGLLLYNFDKIRYLNLKNSIKITKQQYFLRAIVTGISSMVGQTGYLSEHVSLDFKNVIMVIIILFLSFIFIMFLQASITKILIQEQESLMNEHNVNKYNLIGFKGYDTVKKLGRFNAKIELFENKTSDEMVSLYLNNMDKYDGFVLPYCEGFNYVQSNPKLKLSKGFGYEPQSFIVSEEENELLEDINFVINDMRFTLKLKTLCYSYFGDVKNVPVCKL